MSTRAQPTRTSAPKTVAAKEPTEQAVAETKQAVAETEQAVAEPATGAGAAKMRRAETETAERKPAGKSVFVPAKSPPSTSAAAKVAQKLAAGTSGSRAERAKTIAAPAVSGTRPASSGNPAEAAEPAGHEGGAPAAKPSVAKPPVAKQPVAKPSIAASKPGEAERAPEPASPASANSNSQAAPAQPDSSPEHSGAVAAGASPTSTKAATPALDAAAPNAHGQTSLRTPAPHSTCAVTGEPRPAVDPGAAPSWIIGSSTAPLGEINEAVLRFVRGESEAALAHMKALTQVRSAGDFLRLQVGAFQRTADASLACLSSIMRSASRLGSVRRP